MTPPPDNPVAALREEIRRVGRSSSQLWWLLFGVALLLFPAPPHVGPAAYYFLWAPGAAVVLSALAAHGGVAIRLHRQQRRLRTYLARASHDEREAILAPLRKTGHSATRRLAEFLARDWKGDPACISPACAPTGRGDEASPSE
jgi:hypothetical protein